MTQPTRGQRVAARALDLGLAVPLAILTSPIVAVLALASALSLHAQPFFVQQRIGRDGQLFRIVKIRSLPTSVPTDADKYAVAAAGTTRFGSFVRRTHLDELPQLWLVVSGRMSLVGPRPELPELAATTIDPAFGAARTVVRPGCTGYWQISPAANGLIGDHPEFDLFYLAHRSVRLDVWLLAQTVRCQLLGRRPRVVHPPLWALRGSAVPRTSVFGAADVADGDVVVIDLPPAAASRPAAVPDPEPALAATGS